MTFADLKHKKIAILGVGVEGLSTAQFLLKHEAQVTLLDKKPLSQFDETTRQTIASLDCEKKLGEGYMDELWSYHMLVRSPGISVLHEKIQAAKVHGTVITSHTNLFMDFCPSPVIGVTGTKGKGTTSTLIYEMLKKDGRTAFLGGNIGRPPLDFIDELDIHSWVVLELSSFQLQDIHISPHIAVMLMVTSEHLDYHVDTYEYIDAKRNILRFQSKTDYAVLNRDYPATHESDVYTEGKVFQVSRERECDEGCFVKDDIVWVRRDGKDANIIDTADILLPGKHNLENICAATMAAVLAGIPKGTIAAVLQTFTGLEHRLELVATVHGVRYYDDSFSTVPETAIAAIEAFSLPEVLILGGSSKGSDFTELGKVIARATNIKAIIGIGFEWESIKDAIESALPRNESELPPILYIEGSQDMHAVVLAASKIASVGDVVLLSPACASFDMFKNYKERGKQFKEEVLGLQN